jgi:alkanesulfonate monooxygenase SsuD/methylene tetrahydromethanopterin reductase-like flavin-dependent oxidoreductase (luciferase family)
LILGVGAGWSAEEMADHGVAFEDRWKYVRECVLAVREIWGNEIAEYKGEMINFPPMWCGPKPVRGARLPVLVGASGKYAFSRMVEYGDGWIPIDQGDAMGKLMDDARRYLSEHGRVFEDFDHTVIIHPLSASEVDSVKHFGGNPEALKRRVDELHNMGFNRILLQLSFGNSDYQWKELEGLRIIMKAFS